MKFEIWREQTGYFLTSVPSTNRWSVLQEPGAKLLLRIDATNPTEAKEIYERFAFGGNPDRLRSLEQPAEEFLLSAYPCGIRAGDRVKFRKKYQVRLDGRVCGEYKSGLEAEVLAGDSEMPDVIWLKTLNDAPFRGAFSISEEDVCEFLESIPHRPSS